MQGSSAPEEVSLHRAISHGDKVLVKKLLKSTENCLDGYVDNKTPLGYALELKQLEIVDILLEYKPDVNLSSKNQDLLCQPPLVTAASQGYDEIVRKLLDLSADINATRGFYGFGEKFSQFSALQMAVLNRHVSVAEILLKAGVQVDYMNAKKASALHLAVQQGDEAMTRLLLEHGASVNLLGERDRLPIHVACKRELPSLVTLLLDHGALVNQCDCLQALPLHYAVEKGMLDTVKILLAHQADCNIPKEGNVMPLLLACEKGHTDIAQLLLTEGKADPNVEGWTHHRRLPLQLAAIKGNTKMASILLDNGCNINKRDTQYGDNALNWAIRHSATEMVQFLLSRGSEYDFKNIPDEDTSLQIACHFDNAGSCLEIVQLLLERGISIDSQNRQGETALHIAATGNKISLVEELLKAGSNVDATDQFGATALHVAALRGYTQIVQMLLDRGCDLDLMCTRGYAPLHCAILKSQWPTAKLLIRYGCDVNMYGAQGSEPLMYMLCQSVIASNGFRSAEPLEVAELLVASGCKFDCSDDYGRAVLLITQQHRMAKLKEVILSYTCHDSPPLHQLARVAVRHYIKAATNSAQFLKYIDVLPLPLTIKDYLALE